MKEKIIIGKGCYSFQELFDIWHYFRENGVPKFDAGHWSLGSPGCYAVDQLRGYPEFERIVYDYDHLALEDLTIQYKVLYDTFKKVNAELQLKNRGKPLTKEQFKSKAYEDYLKAFDEETERLKKIANIEEEEK